MGTDHPGERASRKAGSMGLRIPVIKPIRIVRFLDTANYCRLWAGLYGLDTAFIPQVGRREQFPTLAGVAINRPANNRIVRVGKRRCILCNHLSLTQLHFVKQIVDLELKQFQLKKRRKKCHAL